MINKPEPITWETIVESWDAPAPDDVYADEPEPESPAPRPLFEHPSPRADGPLFGPAPDQTRSY